MAWPPQSIGRGPWLALAANANEDDHKTSGMIIGWGIHRINRKEEMPASEPEDWIPAAWPQATKVWGRQ
jgi:hypothetical protein